MKKYNSRSIWMKIRSVNLKIGFIISLAFVLFAFQWNTKQVEYQEKVYEPEIMDIEVTPTRTVQKRKVMPPPPKPNILENISTEPELLEWNLEDELDLSDDEDLVISEDVFEGLAKESNSIIDKAAQIKAPITVEDEFILFPSKMPVFGDCVDFFDETERKKCSDKSLMQFIYKELKYPTIASETRIEGRAVAEFIINKEGKVEKIRVLQGLGGGIEEELMRVMNLMPDWQPGKQNQKPVNVKMIIPVKFVLE